MTQQPDCCVQLCGFPWAAVAQKNMVRACPVCFYIYIYIYIHIHTHTTCVYVYVYVYIICDKAKPRNASSDTPALRQRRSAGEIFFKMCCAQAGAPALNSVAAAGIRALSSGVEHRSQPNLRCTSKVVKILGHVPLIFDIRSIILE